MQDNDIDGSGGAASGGVTAPQTVADVLDAETVERCAKVCEQHIEKFADTDNAGGDEAEEAWHGGMAHAARKLATAIRNLAPTKGDVS